MEQADTRVILLADDGPDFGLGHVKRLEYLQQVLEPSIRAKTRLISRDTHPPDEPEDRLRKEFWQIICEELSLLRPRLCVFDLSYSSWDPVWGHLIHSIPACTKLVGIDVPRVWMNRFHHVVHPGIGKSEGQGEYPNWHGGPEWVLAQRNPTWSPNTGTPKMTVTTGSQAFNSFRPWLERELASLSEYGIEISWVVGKHNDEQLGYLQTVGNSISYVDDSQLSERFLGSSLVVTRFGVTAFELTARGIPTIILPGWSDEEEEEVFELERAGVALVARSYAEVTELARDLAHSHSLQSKLSNLGKDYFKLKESHPLSILVAELLDKT